MSACSRYIFVLLTATCFVCGSAWATEITIFDKQGQAVAYLDTDDEATIFLWSGRPVAYVSLKSVYGFNGKHLGWLDQGVFYDHAGYCVGFFKNSTLTLTQLEPLKSTKQLRPPKSLKEHEPMRPLSSSYWSSTPLELFFLDGTNYGDSK